MKYLFPLLLTFPLTAETYFEPNRGHVAGRTQWIARAAGITTYIASNEVVLDRVHMRLVGAAGKARAEGLEPTGGYSNYFVGRNRKGLVYNTSSNPAPVGSIIMLYGTGGGVLTNDVLSARL